MEHFANWREVLHDRARSANCADGQAAADYFPETRDVWANVVLRLRTARTETKAGDDLVKNK